MRCAAVIAPLPRSATLIVNAKSRKGRRLFRAAKRLLERSGIRIDAAHAVRDPQQLPAKVKEVVEAGTPMVIVGGGDGSLSSSVDHLVGHDTVFALLPLGTANSFARTLGIPLDLEGAVEVIALGERRRIDLGMIDHDYFANCAAIGVSPLIGQSVPHGLKARAGRLGYLLWALIQLGRFQPFRLTIGEGQTAETVDALEVRIANGSYHGGTELVENAAVDSGDIVIQAVIGRARWRLGWSWFASVWKLPGRDQTVREFRGQKLRIATDPSLPISIDGEVLAHTPAVAQVARAIIEVAAPRSG